MRKNPWLMAFVLFFVFGALFLFFVGTATVSYFGGGMTPKVLAKDSILKLELNGIIMDGKKLLKPLLKYKADPNIKAIVVEINSPGGIVGPSQEIYSELKRVRNDLKKPVVAVSTGLMASGAYYVAAAADKVVVAPGTLVGSIGVIMEFTNLEKLYDWAKIGRFSLTTGKYKDSGAEYRPMRDDERLLFQTMIDDVWMQFKEAVAEGRSMRLSDVEEYADGRIFTGSFAVEKKFADQLGTTQDAYKLAADLAGISDWKVFEPPKEKKGFWDYFGEEEDPYTTQIEKISEKVLRTELNHRPLFLMPGVF